MLRTALLAEPERPAPFELGLFAFDLPELLLALALEPLLDDRDFEAFGAFDFVLDFPDELFEVRDLV